MAKRALILLNIVYAFSAFSVCSDDVRDAAASEDDKPIRLFWMKHFTLADQIDRLFRNEEQARRVATDIAVNAVANPEIADAVTQLEKWIRTKLSVKPGYTIVKTMLGLTEVDDEHYVPKKVALINEDGSVEMVAESDRPAKRVIVQVPLTQDGPKIAIETTDYKQEYLPGPVQQTLRTMLLVLAASSPFRVHPQILGYFNEDFMETYNVGRQFKSIGEQCLKAYAERGTDMHDLWEATEPDVKE